ADVLEQLEIVAGRNDEATLAENGFGNDGGDGFGRDGTLERVFEIVSEPFSCSTVFATVRIGERDAVDVACKRLEARFVGMSFTGQRHREERATVEGVLEANDRRAFGIGAGDLDGIFDSLGAGVDQNSFLRKIARCQRVQFLRHRNVALVRSDSETEMEELL